jgi:hypothetical protein
LVHSAQALQSTRRVHAPKRLRRIAARSFKSDDEAAAAVAARFAGFAAALLFAAFVTPCFGLFFALFVALFFPAIYMLSFCQGLIV